MRSARTVGSLIISAPGLVRADGRVCICNWISERGSIDRPRVAVTSFCCTPCCEKAEKAFMVEVPDVKPVPLRRNIAEGFSLDSIPNSWKPLPGPHEDRLTFDHLCAWLGESTRGSAFVTKICREDREIA